jgi:hypothetical protein
MSSTPTLITTQAPKILRTPNSPKPKRQMLKGLESVGNNFLLIGAPETGKSSFIADLAMNGLKTLTIFTDLGNTGLNGMRTYAHTMKKLDAFSENHRYVLFQREELEEVEEFLTDPDNFLEGFSEFNPDIIAWDGFGFHLSMAVTPDVEELVNKDSKLDGLGFDSSAMLKGWGYVKNAIIRVLDRFLTIKPGTTKIVTVGCRYIQVIPDLKDPGARKQLVTDEPDIPTGAKRIIQHGFDLALVTKVAARDDGAIKKGEFYYVLAGDYCKKRYRLPDIVPAGAFKLYQEIQKQRK